MQHHQINTSGNEYSHGRHIASDAIRGFAVGVRGYLEGRKLRRDAKDDRERRFADEAYRQKLMDLQERQITLDDAFRNEQLEANTGIQDRLTKIEEGKYDHEAHMYQLMVADKAEQANLQRQHEIALSELQAAQQKGNIEATAAAQVKVDESKARLDAIENRIQHREQMLILDKQGEIATEQTQTAGEENRKTQALAGDQAIEHIEKTGEEQRATDTNRIQEESNAKLLLESLKRIASTGNTGMVALDEDEWGRYKGIFIETRQLQAVKDMADIAQGYQTAMQGYVSSATGGETRTLMEQKIAQSVGKTPEQIQAEIDANRHLLGGDGFTMADMAIINGYQRMIDPGATVREGDVGALLSALGAGGQIQAQWVSILEGGRFTEQSREQLAAIILDNYRTNLRNVWAVAGQPINALIERAGLASSGVTMQEFLPGWVDLAGVTPQDIATTRDPFAGRTTQRADGRVPANATPQTATLDERAIEGLVDASVEDIRELYEADPNFDAGDRGELRNNIQFALQSAETAHNVTKGAYVDRYLDEVYQRALEKLGVTTGETE